MATAKQIASWYAQAFHLVLQDGPLFSDEIVAWQKGPVVGAVYTHYAGFGWNPIIPDDDTAAAPLPTLVTEFLKQIISFLGATRQSRFRKRLT